jgi:hypothetical protein
VTDDKGVWAFHATPRIVHVRCGDRECPWAVCVNESISLPGRCRVCGSRNLVAEDIVPPGNYAIRRGRAWLATAGLSWATFPRNAAGLAEWYAWALVRERYAGARVVERPAPDHDYEQVRRRDAWRCAERWE